MMHQRSLKHNNKGYSLVELIISMAIIVLLTGAAMLTMSMINSAKAREASVTFTSEISETSAKSKNQMVILPDESGVLVMQPTYSHCIKVYFSEGNECYYIKKGYFNPAGETEEDMYIFQDSENVNGGRGISMTSKVTIKYKSLEADASEEEIESVYIVFDRSGMCIQGAGTYSFYKKNGNLIADVNLNKNGSYQSY